MWLGLRQKIELENFHDKHLTTLNSAPGVVFNSLLEGHSSLSTQQN